MSQTQNVRKDLDGHPGPSNWRSGYVKTGWTSNHVTPTNYTGYGGSLSSRKKLRNGLWVQDGGLPTGGVDPTFLGTGNPFPHARNKAWSKFVNKVRTDPANLGTFLAEGREGLEMVARRASQGYRAFRDLRRGDMFGFLRELGIRPNRKTLKQQNLLRRGAKSASDMWLEYSFGWKPLFQDIYQGAQAIQQPVPAGPVSGSGTTSFAYNERDYFGNPLNETRGKGCCKIGADVFVSNPNLYLMQQMGVANPFLVAWELVPFSFVVDWVFDVGSSLGAVTDLLGCDVQNAYYTDFLSAQVVLTAYDVDWSRLNSWGHVWAVRRHTGLPTILPNLDIRANLGSSLNRAANAVSLLGQIMAG